MSTVPAAVTALVTLTKTALPKLTVIDGEPLRNLPADFAAIGWNGEQPAITVTRTIFDAGIASSVEEYDVDSQLVAWDGSPENVAAKRARVYGYLAAITTALQTNPHLGGVVMLAQIANSDLTQSQTDQGALAVLTFTTHIRAME